MSVEFVTFDAEGKEVDWIDPVIKADEIRTSIWLVDNGFDVHEVHIPEGGRHEIRRRK